MLYMFIKYSWSMRFGLEITYLIIASSEQYDFARMKNKRTSHA